MSLFPIVVTALFAAPNLNPDVPAGTVQFDPTAQVLDAADGLIVAAETSFVYVDANGRIAVPLLPTDVAGLKPPNMQYRVTIDIGGAATRQGYISVPHAPAGSRTVTDMVTAAGSNIITSATAAFTGGDVGRYVSGTNLPGSTPGQMVVISVTNATTAVIAGTATASGTGGTLIVGASADLSSLLNN